jgi:hypothetical protein
LLELMETGGAIETRGDSWRFDGDWGRQAEFVEFVGFIEFVEFVASEIFRDW